MSLFAGEGGGFPPQQQMIEQVAESSSYGWEFWLTLVSVVAAVIGATVPAVALYLKYRRRNRCES